MVHGNVLQEEVPPHLIDFASQVYEGFDESHDMHHGLAVWGNVQVLIQREGISLTPDEKIELMYVAILHDGQDHKYQGKSKVDYEHFTSFFVDHLGADRATRCLHIINNISWSKQQRGENKFVEGRDILRQIVQDADWLEALGETGLKRAITYAESHGGMVPSDVCKHIREKLIWIPYKLNTASARKLAMELIKPIIEYYDTQNLR